MTRFVAIAVFSLSMRVFSAPSLCAHSSPGNNIDASADLHVSHCHDGQKHETKKRVPCNHMQECLLDGGSDESFVLKSVNLEKIENKLVMPVFTLLFNDMSILKASGYNSGLRSPPLIPHKIQPIFLSKSSFLI